jgi:hypothetical protein
MFDLHSRYRSVRAHFRPARLLEFRPVLEAVSGLRFLPLFLAGLTTHMLVRMLMSIESLHGYGAGKVLDVGRW